MKIAFINIAHNAICKWTGHSASNADNSCPRFPIVVALTDEGQIMNGPSGLRLITPEGATPVEETPEGFMVYQPYPHILNTTAR